MKTALIGFGRGLGVVVLAAILAYVGDANNLSFLSPVTASLIASVALALENAMESKNGKAFFGAVRSH